MIVSPEQVTPVWLTSILRQASLLSRGKVLAIDQQPTGAFNSATIRLLVTYTPDTLEGVPHSFILKCSNGTAWGNQANRKEVQFYQFIATLPNYPPLMVPCYGAAFDEMSDASYLLLLDLSPTHLVPVPRDQQIAIEKGENVPAEVYIERAIDTLAAFHAYWWEHELLGSERVPIDYNDIDFVGYWQRRREAVEWLLHHEREFLSPQVQTMCAQTAAHFDHWWTDYLAPRMQEKSRITMIHGDAYFANMLSPREGTMGATYLIDWQSAEPHVGAFDLVNLCATFWTRKQRHERQREQRILQRYFTQLQARGVQNYSWENLLLDYRLEIIEWLLITVQDARNGSKRSYWQPKLQCMTEAFEDWHCSDLLIPGMQ
ncbi:phosphotransferase family protein [Ktedonospora formicarum]|uniref:CHK kinase-like domain-containing protein n=1 Tax=Ktedonospora formicarum TaxID=2778364 RepID=A0A8J3MWG0_9CHLR|nr:oxidoreductase family protein [Ktedonospora formicarum]GHO51402.1 hypothetical protein KSX_95650 [Ktedonospora formicarum]